MKQINNFKAHVSFNLFFNVLIYFRVVQLNDSVEEVKGICKNVLSGLFSGSIHPYISVVLVLSLAVKSK